MRADDPRVRWLGWAALVLLLANGLVFLFLVLPGRDQRREQEQQLLDLQRRIRTLQREGESSEVLLTAFREVEAFGQRFPRRGELVELIGRLTKLARSLAVEIPTVDYRPSQLKEAGLTKVTVVMGVDGPYGKIRRYLYELEGMRRYLVIEQLSLRDSRGTSGLQVQLQLAVYVQ